MWSLNWGKAAAQRSWSLPRPRLKSTWTVGSRLSPGTQATAAGEVLLSRGGLSSGAGGIPLADARGGPGPGHGVPAGALHLCTKTRGKPASRLHRAVPSAGSDERQRQGWAWAASSRRTSGHGERRCHQPPSAHCCGVGEGRPAPESRASHPKSGPSHPSPVPATPSPVPATPSPAPATPSPQPPRVTRGRPAAPAAPAPSAAWGLRGRGEGLSLCPSPPLPRSLPAVGVRAEKVGLDQTELCQLGSHI